MDIFQFNNLFNFRSSRGQPRQTPNHHSVRLRGQLPANSSKPKLSLAGSRENLTNDHVTTLVERCNTLIELDLSDSTIISDKAISAIIANLSKNLVKLSVSRCFEISATKFLDLVNMQELKNLSVYGMLNSVKLEILRKQLPQISINEAPWCYIARSSQGERKIQLWDVRL